MKISMNLPGVLLKLLPWLFLLLTSGCKKEDGSEKEDCENPMPGFAFYPSLLLSNDPATYITRYDSEIMLFHFDDNLPRQYLQECPDLSCADASLSALPEDLALHQFFIFTCQILCR